MRAYRQFRHREASFRINRDAYGPATREIVRQRAVLEDTIRRMPEFRTSLTPLQVASNAPAIVRSMARAATAAGVGPMAAVAGAVAQAAAEAALAEGVSEAIVDNGGDVFASSSSSVVIGLYTGDTALGDRLALRVDGDRMPLAVCSSSGRMGRSMSLGACDLATAAARDGALADAVATAAANAVRVPADIDAALERYGAIPGIEGLLLVKEDRVGIKGSFPPLIQTP
jgi:ApbE superfamily uncharacterized protein (UPF0280 family)